MMLLGVMEVAPSASALFGVCCASYLPCGAEKHIHADFCLAKTTVDRGLDGLLLPTHESSYTEQFYFISCSFLLKYFFVSIFVKFF